MSKGTTVFGSPDAFAADMRRLINDEEMSDICFVVGEDKEKIYAHKIILAGRCEVFRAMFAEQKQLSKTATKPAAGATKGKAATQPAQDADTNVPLVLPDVRPTVFLTLLEFIYTNSCKLSQSTVVDVLASAIEYNLESLAKCCVQFLTSGIKIETACEAMQAAITYNQTELRDTCMVFIEQNTQAVFKSRAFVEMSEDTLAFILQSDNLQINERDVLAAVKEWATVNSVVSGKTESAVAARVIENVRFALLDGDTLAKFEKDNEKSNIAPVRLIAKAWKYHARKESDPSDPQTRPRAGTVRS